MTDDVEIVPFFGGERGKVIQEVVTFVQATKEEAVTLAHDIVGDANVHALVIHKGLTTNPEPVAYMVEALREWRGLPDMEVFDLADKHLYGGENYAILSFYQAIESKLKEKNACT